MAQVDAPRFLSHVANLFAPNILDGQVFTAYIGQDNSFTILADNIIRDSDSANFTPTEVVDNLTSSSTTSALSANQGRVLKALIDGNTSSVIIANNLTTSTAGQALDATQGKILNEAKQNNLTQVQTINSWEDTDYLYLERGGTIYKIQASKIFGNTDYSLMYEGMLYEPGCGNH